MNYENMCCKIIIVLIKVLIMLELATRIECSDARPQTRDDFHKYYTSYYPTRGLESYDSLFRDLGKFKKKLQLQSVQELTEAAHQNPIDLLRMIPQIIIYFRTGSATEQEHQLMQSIFGKLWHSIEDEINRGDVMDPLLQGILQTIRKSDSIKSRQLKSNSVLIRRRRNLVSCVSHANISPADNLMNCVWSLITRYQRSLGQSVARKNRSLSSSSSPSSSKNSRRSNNKNKSSSTRHKRSLIVDRSSDVEVLKSFINMINSSTQADNSQADEDSQESVRPSIYELFHLANMHKIRKLAQV